MKFNRLSALVVAAGLVLTGTASAPRASAAAYCVIGATTYSPAVFVLGTTHGKEMTVTTKVTNCDENGLNYTDVSWWINDGSNVSQLAFLDQMSYSGSTITLKGKFYEKPSRLMNVNAGDAPTFVQVEEWYSGRVVRKKATPVLQFRRAVAVTTNATPEPVTKGKALTINGTVKRASWDTYKYSGYAKHKMDLQFQTPTGSFTTIKQIYSDSKGNLKTTVTASKDGCYRYLSKQTSTAGAAVSVGDCVDVK
jgi:hypothetical protein